jgi:hypothetical protein
VVRTLQAKNAPPVYRPQPPTGPIMQSKMRSLPLGAVIQMKLHTYSDRQRSKVGDIAVNDAAASGMITLTGRSNGKVNGELHYMHEQDVTTLKIIRVFPQGYGLGTLLLYHLGELAKKAGSKKILVLSPALTEMDFYVKHGATFKLNGSFQEIWTSLHEDEETRQFARLDIAAATAEKEQDSRRYFAGDAKRQLKDLSERKRENILSDQRARVSPEAVALFILHKARYSASPKGLFFRDIDAMMSNCQESMRNRWEKPATRCVVS